MSLRHKKTFWISGAAVVCAFVALLSIRMDLFRPDAGDAVSLDFSSAALPAIQEDWMAIIQNNKKIGYSHAVFSKTESGFLIEETVSMRINTMGMVQDIHLENRGGLHPNFTLESFETTIRSGRFEFTARGSMAGDALVVKTKSAGAEKEISIPVGTAPYLLSGAIRAINASRLKKGDRRTFEVFDPGVMGHAPVVVEVLGKEDIDIQGERRVSTKVSLDFRGASQTAWIGENGEILKEKGPLGIRLEKTSREAALSDASREASQDLTLLASVKSNATFDDPRRLSRLKVRLGGVDPTRLRLDGGRQTLENGVLAIRKETLEDPPGGDEAPPLAKPGSAYLDASAFIQSDHPDIRTLVGEIVAEEDSSLQKARKLIDWVHENIEKKPALSMPDALSTLRNRLGDCNEHAVLLAAMARAAGIPAKVEAGLAYLRGRFYYHAWNSLYLGQWITADSVFGQLPADVTHIRLSSGGPARQLDLVGLIGKVTLTVLEYEKDPK